MVSLGAKHLVGMLIQNKYAQNLLIIHRWMSCCGLTSDGSSRLSQECKRVAKAQVIEGLGWQMLTLEEAFMFLDRVVELPSVDNFICILQKCRKRKDLTYAKRVHAHICNNGMETHRTVGNYIVPMFVECGSLPDAQQVFNRLVYRNEHSWTSLILGYIQGGQSQHALDLYQKMQESSVQPSSFTFVPLLKACAVLKDVQKGKEVHVEIAQQGYERQLVVGNTLVSMYAKCGSLKEAQEVLESLSVRDVVSWNALITGYAEHGPAWEALKCFEQMQLEGTHLNAVSFVCALKACGSIGAIHKGQEINAEIAKKGLERDVLVGNSLIDMYMKCSSITDAQKVFDDLPVPDVVSMNALIAGYVEHGFEPEAVKCLEQMQLEGISPNAVTFICALKACSSLGAAGKGLEIHREITKQGFESYPLIGSALVGMYAKCCSLSQAQEVFYKLPVQETLSWIALIGGYAEHGPGQEALLHFEQMQLEGVSPSVPTFVSVLKACGSIGALDKGREMHMKIIQKEFDKDHFLSCALVGMYGKCGSLLEAREVFDQLSVHDVVLWNSLITAYVEYGFGQQAMACFEQMPQEGVSLDVVTFVCALKACGSMGAIDKGQKIHMVVTLKGFTKDLFVSSTLVYMYAKCGLLLDAQEIFDKLALREVALWTSLIARYAEHGPAQEALKCFDQMQWEGICPTLVTFASVLKACGSLAAIDKGKEIHTELTQQGSERECLVGNALVAMYAKCGWLSEARGVLSKLSIRENMSWTALITGYAEVGAMQEALECFDQMQLEGVSPDAVTFVSVLKACCSMGALDKGQEIYEEITRKGFERDPFVCNNLVDMYTKCGCFSEAREVFSKVLICDVVSWTTLIAGYAEYGPCQQALDCFEQMHLEGISPNAGTYACVLKACGSTGAIEKGRELHTQIKQKGFETDPFIISSLVDMYAKCGSLSEAQEAFVKPAIQDVVAWNTLIAGYAMNHEVNMALNCFKDMQEQGATPNAVTFTCLLTACSHERLVFHGQEYFRMMREDFGITPTEDHYTCMVDLLARSGNFLEAVKFLEAMPCPVSEGTWRALLSGCKTYGEAEVGLRCFHQLVQMNPEDASSYVLMADMYASEGRWDDALRIEELRKHSGAKKKPASALIEVNKMVHEFVVGQNQSNEISAMLEMLSARSKDDGLVPNLDMVLRPISDEGKGAALCEHAEKLAIAFGLLNTPQGQTLRVTKNLRMCNDCHHASKIISRIERREIIVRDVCCIHHFKDGLCSCRDIF